MHHGTEVQRSLMQGQGFSCWYDISRTVLPDEFSRRYPQGRNDKSLNLSTEPRAGVMGIVQRSQRAMREMGTKRRWEWEDCGTTSTAVSTTGVHSNQKLILSAPMTHSCSGKKYGHCESRRCGACVISLDVEHCKISSQWTFLKPIDTSLLANVICLQCNFK